MKIFRFMSYEEFEKYKKGEILVNIKKHKANTTSVGFCFLDSKDFTPEQAYEFLYGIVSNDICVEFELETPCLKKSTGVYAKPGGLFWEDFKVEEYCTKTYSKGSYKIVRYAKPVFKVDWNKQRYDNSIEWQWQFDIN